MDGCQPCQAFLDSLEQTVEECRRQRPTRLGQRAAARTRKAILANFHRTISAAEAQEA